MLFHVRNFVTIRRKIVNTVGFSFWILYEVFTMSLKLGVYSSNVAQGEEEHLLEHLGIFALLLPRIRILPWTGAPLLPIALPC